MKRHWIVAPLLFAASCATLEAPWDAGKLPAEVRATPARYVIVTFRNEVNRASPGVGSTPRGYNSIAPYAAGREAHKQARLMAERYRLEPAAAWPIAPLRLHCLVYRIAPGADRDALLAQLRLDPAVESAQPLQTFHTQASRYNDTYAGLQRNLEQLAVPQAHLLSRGHRVHVAVVDTGVAIKHADLAGRVGGWKNFVDEDSDQFERDRHGTAVAGIIAAVANNHLGIVGIAPEVKLSAFKACWETAVNGAAACNTFTLARALAAAIQARADIVNLSLAGPSDPLLARLIDAGRKAGMIFVGAVPPPGTAGGPVAGFPLDVAGVLAVVETTSGHSDGSRLAVPGQDIFTLAPADRYEVVSGSSFAAAQVSALIALLRARDFTLSAERAHRLLLESSRPVLTHAGTRNLINACRAIAVLAPGTDCEEFTARAGRHADASVP